VTEPLDPDEFAELKRRVGQLRVDQAETRWILLNADDGIQTVRENVRSARREIAQIAESVNKIADRLTALADRFGTADQVRAEQHSKTDSHAS
jgi:chromosome segregation ATPase